MHLKLMKRLIMLLNGNITTDWDCQCNIVSSGQLYAFSCLRYSLRPQKCTEEIFLTEISVYKNQEIYYVNAVFLLGCGQLMVFHTSVIIRVHILQNECAYYTHARDIFSTSFWARTLYSAAFLFWLHFSPRSLKNEGAYNTGYYPYYD